MARVTVGVSLKTYFGNADARRWFDRVAELARTHAAVASGEVDLFVIPTFLQLGAALDSFAGTHVRVGAQDVSAYPAGAYTGEVAAAELHEVGATLAEIGHAERRRLFGETDDVVAAKAAAALTAGLTPVLCVGETRDETSQMSSKLGPGSAFVKSRPDRAAAEAIGQVRAGLDGAPAGPVIVAYEPVWAIGADEPAPADHIRAVTEALREAVTEVRPGSIVIYGGSAGPGLLTRLGDSVDGLFLGRFAHDITNLGVVLDEAGALSKARRAVAAPSEAHHFYPIAEPVEAHTLRQAQGPEERARGPEEHAQGPETETIS